MEPVANREPIEATADGRDDDELPFRCESALRFSLLSLATLGFYQCLWFYRNWVRIKERSGRRLSPFWRAFFAPLFCYSLAREVDSVAVSQGLPQRTSPGVLAATYALISMLHQQPDPYWLLSLLSFAPLLPIVRQIQAVHGSARPGCASESGWSGGSVAVTVVGLAFLGLSVIGSLGPPSHALREAEIPASYRTRLVEEGLVAPEERIRFFYSAGLLSMLEDGNLLTDSGVVSYFTEDGELYAIRAGYSEIVSVDVEYSNSILQDTVLTVSTVAGDAFVLLVSAEQGLDREFVSELSERIQALRSPATTA